MTRVQWHWMLIALGAIVVIWTVAGMVASGVNGP